MATPKSWRRVSSIVAEVIAVLGMHRCIDPKSWTASMSLDSVEGSARNCKSAARPNSV